MLYTNRISFLLAFSLFFCCLQQITAQWPLQQEWAQALGGPNFDYSGGMTIDPSGNVYLAGYFNDSLQGLSSAGASDGFIAKYNKQGSLLWLRRFGGAGDDRPRQLAYANGQLYLTGFFEQIMYFGNDSLQATDRDEVLLLCLDTLGNWQWGRSFNGNGSQQGAAVAVDSLQHIYLSGYFEDTLQAGTLQLASKGFRDAFILQLDSLGQPLWGYGMGGSTNNEGLDFAFDAQDNAYLVGYYRDQAQFGPFQLSSVFTYDCFMASWRPNGQWRYVKSFGGGYVDNCPTIVYQPQRARLVVGGWFFNEMSFDSLQLQASGEEESFLAAFDTSGVVQWAKRMGDEFAELIYELDIDAEERIYAIGSFDSIIYLGNDTIVAKHFTKPTDLFVLGFTAEGQYRFGFQAGDVYGDFGLHLAVFDSNRIYVAGAFSGQTILGDTLWGNGNYDAFLAKYFLDTSLIKPTAVAQIPESSAFKLYPNPAQGCFYLEMDALPTQTISIRIFDSTGHLQQHFQLPPAQRILVNVEDLPKGLYFVQVNGWVVQLIVW